MNDKVFATIGATNHTEKTRPNNDYYTTDPIAIDLLQKHHLLGKGKYWECACGKGDLSERLKYYGYDVYSSDISDHGYGDTGIDFLNQNRQFENILTNPPYTLITDFILKGLELAENSLYIFGRIQLLESMGRWEAIFRGNPPTYVCPFVKRVSCYHDGVKDNKGSAVCYAWFIWHKKLLQCNRTQIKWLI